MSLGPGFLVLPGVPCPSKGIICVETGVVPLGSHKNRTE